MERVTRIVGKGKATVKLRRYMVGPKTHYHSYPIRIYTIEWDLVGWITEFKKERYIVALVRNMSWCYQSSYVGEGSIEEALNTMFAERLKVHFIS